MSASRPDNEEIFHAARDIPDPDRRRNYVREACGGDEARIADVEALLAASDSPDSLLNPPAAVAPVRTVELAATERPGTVIGPYKLIEEIGEGGMGSVFLAQQTEPVKRVVAVKVIKAGMDSKTVLARFEAERQALAVMDHPNIARVLDAGTTESGRPFFVMELVKGAPITKFCDERKLTPRQRLELFVPVCQAIQHAHQKGVIHRDIKPSNVLVALYDDRPVPKVIDFGVAKATGQSLTDKTLMTGLGAIVGTLEYMSPEQANLNNLDIDTRSDVYALGVLMYELLTGSPPFSKKELDRKGLLEMLRVLREEEPPRPSTKLSTADSLPTLSANRGTEPKKLTGLLRYELDWIVMKALEKDRTRRYETANGFAADVLRYLAGEAVLAHPPSTRYRVKKFVRRNRAMVTTGSCVATALLAGVVAFAWQARIANRQTRIAQDNERRANENYLLARQAVDDYLTRVSENTLLRVQPSRDLRELRKQLLEDALKFYRSFIDQHRDDPGLRRELARAYVRVAKITDAIGSRPDALAGHSKALEIRRSLADADPDDPTLRVEVAETLQAIGVLQRSMGRSADAVAALEEARRLLDDVFRSNPDIREAAFQLAKVNSFLGAAHVVSAQWDLARPLYDRANELLSRLVEADPAEPKYLRELAWSIYRLGNLLSDPLRPDPNFAAAKASYDDALSLHHRLIAAHPREPDYPIDMAQCYVSLASLVYNGNHDTPGAVRYLELALDLQKRVVATHPTVTLYLLDLSATYYQLAYYSSKLPGCPDVVRWYRESIALGERLAELDPENVDFQDRLGRSVSNLGFNLLLHGEIDQAVREYLRAIEIHRRVQATQTNEPRLLTPLAVALEGLGEARAAQRKPEEALEAYRKALAIRQQLADTHPANIEFQNALADIQSSIGRAQSRQKRFTEALTAIETGLAIRQKLAEADFTNTAYSRGLGNSHAYRGTARVRAGQLAEAAVDLRLALALWAKAPHLDIEEQVERSRSLAQLAGLGAEAKSGVTKEEARTFADQSVAVLADAVKAGWALPSELKEPDFDALRGRDDFKKLVEEVEVKQKKVPETGPRAEKK
jgi:serine/threonine protein kinase/tetratricopeptide (TPR) repeat protein